MNYKASKDMTVQIITLIVILLFVFIGYKNVTGILHSNGNMTVILVHSLSLLLFMGILLFSYSYAPDGYYVERDNLIIHKPAATTIIAISSINEIRQVDKQELKGMIRTFGVGGLFGIYGKFYAPKIGNITLYGTQSKNYVLIITDKKKIIITPDDLGIIDEIKNYTGSRP